MPRSDALRDAAEQLLRGIAGDSTVQWSDAVHDLAAAVNRLKEQDALHAPHDDPAPAAGFTEREHWLMAMAFRAGTFERRRNMTDASGALDMWLHDEMGDGNPVPGPKRTVREGLLADAPTGKIVPQSVTDALRDYRHRLIAFALCKATNAQADAAEASVLASIAALTPPLDATPTDRIVVDQATMDMLRYHLTDRDDEGECYVVGPIAEAFLNRCVVVDGGATA